MACFCDVLVAAHGHLLPSSVGDRRSTTLRHGLDLVCSWISRVTDADVPQLVAERFFFREVSVCTTDSWSHCRDDWNSGDEHFQ